MKNGIDVSWANGNIDWSKVKTDFAMIKCNTGVNSLDTHFIANAKGAASHSIPTGFYHWCTLNKIDIVSDAKSEAADFIKSIKLVPAPTIPCALDIEEENKLNISPNNIERWIRTFYQELKSAGVPMCLYSYGPWLNNNLPKDHKLLEIPLWIAQYPKDITKTPNPILPFGWKDWHMWQYSARGSMPGITGMVDLNFMK